MLIIRYGWTTSKVTHQDMFPKLLERLEKNDQ